MRRRPEQSIYGHDWRAHPDIPKGEEARKEWMARNVRVTNTCHARCARCPTRPTTLIRGVGSTPTAVCNEHVGLNIRIARLDSHGRIVA